MVTGDHDEIGCGDLRFSQYGFQNRKHAVHIGQNRNLANHGVIMHAARCPLHDPGEEQEGSLA